MCIHLRGPALFAPPPPPRFRVLFLRNFFPRVSLALSVRRCILPPMTPEEKNRFRPGELSRDFFPGRARALTPLTSDSENYGARVRGLHGDAYLGAYLKYGGGSGGCFIARRKIIPRVYISRRITRPSWSGLTPRTPARFNSPNVAALLQQMERRKTISQL